MPVPTRVHVHSWADAQALRAHPFPMTPLPPLRSARYYYFSSDLPWYFSNLDGLNPPLYPLNPNMPWETRKGPYKTSEGYLGYMGPDVPLPPLGGTVRSTQLKLARILGRCFAATRVRPAKLARILLRVRALIIYIIYIVINIIHRLYP